ncbi:MAG: hypothetical protein AB8C13_00105 [Phycisphaerales bacterium]
MLDPNADILNRAVHLMRSSWSATLLYDQSPFDSRCMIDPRSGVFIMSIVPDALDANDIVLAAPRDSYETQIRISVTLDATVSEEQQDRFTAYHIPASTPLLACAKMVYAKLDSGEVVTDEQCSLSNPLISKMPSLCRALNSDRDRLSRICASMTGVSHETPIAVGVDDRGIDIRARFGLVRCGFDTPIENIDEAPDRIASMMESADA